MNPLTSFGNTALFAYTGVSLATTALICLQSPHAWIGPLVMIGILLSVWSESLLPCQPCPFIGPNEMKQLRHAERIDAIPIRRLENWLYVLSYPPIIAIIITMAAVIRSRY